MVGFRDLITCRPMDGPIPWTAAQLYAKVNGLEPDVAALFWRVVRHLDQTERRWRYENPDKMVAPATDGQVQD